MRRLYKANEDNRYKTFWFGTILGKL